MARYTYEIVVVDQNPKPFAGARGLIEAGVPPKVATTWVQVRRTMSPKGLAKKARENRN